jgi:uncharacterized membrane protein
MKWNSRRDILPAVVVVICIVFTALVWNSLPATLPTHFAADGTPNQFSPKTTAVILSLSMIAGLYLLLTFIPLLDPFWHRIEGKYNVFLIFRDIVVTFFALFHIGMLYAALTGKLQTAIVGTGIGLLLILLGNYLPRLPRNFFFGIRSPWTLASDVVWTKTHILSGWIFVCAGIVMIVLCLTGLNVGIVTLVTLLPTALFCAIIYPLVLYKKLQKEGKLLTPEL